MGDGLADVVGLGGLGDAYADRGGSVGGGWS